MMLITKRRSNKRRSCSSAILYTTNPTWSGLWLNTCIRSERLTANCLCHYTARVNSRAEELCTSSVFAVTDSSDHLDVRREYPKTQRHSVREHCSMVRAIVRSNFLRTRCGARRLCEGAGEHSDLPVLYTEQCQYNYGLCLHLQGFVWNYEECSTSQVPYV